jgi:hypothetical protein
MTFVDSRLFAIDSRLFAIDSQLFAVDSRLFVADSRLFSVDSRLFAVDSRLLLSTFTLDFYSRPIYSRPSTFRYTPFGKALTSELSLYIYIWNDNSERKVKPQMIDCTRCLTQQKFCP